MVPVGGRRSSIGGSRPHCAAVGGQSGWPIESACGQLAWSDPQNGEILVQQSNTDQQMSLRNR